MQFKDASLKRIIKDIDFESINKNPNILIAANFWEEERLKAAQLCYKFMRTLDDLIDNQKSKDETLSCMDQQRFTETINNWTDCLNGLSDGDGFLEQVSHTIQKFKIPLLYFNNFARSMIFDVNNDFFPTFDDFIAYSEGASNGPASVFVHLACLEQKDGVYEQPHSNISDLARPCAMFSYIVHIIRDFQKDQLDNLNYFAKDIMDRYGLTPSDLKEIAGSGRVTKEFRNMIRFYYQEASKYKEQTADTLNHLNQSMDPRYYFSLVLIYDLYLQIYERIDADNGSFTTEALNPTPTEVRDRVNCMVNSYIG